MKEKKISTNFLFVLGLIVLAAATRFIPHPPNFAPIAGVALFGAAYFKNKWAAFVLPAVVMLVTDAVLGFHSALPFVYLGFGLIVGIGFLLRGKISVGRVAGASLAGSGAFFVVSNFGVWIATGYYPLTFEGLLTCYAMAIPFLHNTVVGDLVYTGALFGAYELAKAKAPQLRLQRVEA
jgi:hypothetical protein